jgi:flagellar biosynthetic protein FlhB
MAGGDEDKTEDATPKKKDESFEKGMFPRSQEVNTVIILASTFIVIAFAGPQKLAAISSLTTHVLGHLHDIRLTQENAVILIRDWSVDAFLIILPLLAAVTAGAIIAGGLQTGFKLTSKVLEADINKLNPAKGFGRIINKTVFVQLFVDIVKLTAMMGVLYGMVQNVMHDPIFSSPVPITYIGGFLYSTFIEMLSRMLEVMVAIAIIDYFWQRWKTNEDMKMSKQEVKDERRQSEGDPMVKSQLRSMSMKILRQSIKKHVPTADVVVTNPTHYAVALKYEQGIDKAPVVVAKGEGRIAMHIKQIAAEHGVPMVENRPVARLLYKTTKVGHMIPLELFQVVAQILAHVYRTHRYYFYRLKAQRMAERAAEATAKAV